MSAMVFQWSPGTRAKRLNAQSVGERLMSLRESTGALTASIVVMDARDPASVYHSYFDWDDSVAGPKWREQQANYLIRHCVVASEENEDKKPVHAFSSITEIGERYYVATYEAMSDADMRQRLLDQALSELRAFQVKYQALAELAAVFEALEQLAA